MLGLARPLVILLAISMALAGCIGKDDVTPAAPTPDGNVTTEQNATLPDGRGESAGLLETNKTEEGVGGIEHKHDYWQGQTRVVLFDETVGFFCPPCMPDGEGTQPKSVTYIKLGKTPDGEHDAMVYEGASSVEILFGPPEYDLIGDERVPSAAHPSPPSLFMQYRTAADSEWREPMPVTYGTPIILDVAADETDMPHSTHSLWVFRLTTDRPESGLAVPMTVTVVKGGDVVDWPGHPDFYAEKASRIVMQQHVTTHMSGIESAALYDSGGTWANPEKLISWGTTEIRVIINVTKTSNAYNAEPTGFFLEAHNATIIGPEITFGSRHREVAGGDLRNYEYALLVDETGMDGPYQPGSRWGFRMMATFADIDGVVGFCPGCFPYDIEYDITVIAMNYETGDGQEMEEI